MHANRKKMKIAAGLPRGDHAVALRAYIVRQPEYQNLSKSGLAQAALEMIMQVGLKFDGHGVIFRVKRRREEEPLKALMVAERAPKRGAGVSLQECMDSLSLGSGMPGFCGGSEAIGTGAGGFGTESGPTGEDTINTSTSRCMRQTSCSSK